MAHLHKKMKNGKPYYYVREIARVDGKPKVIKQVYLGPPERLIALVRGDRVKCSRISVQEFGALWLACQIEERVDLISIIDSVVPRTARETGPSVGEYFIYAVFNRMIDACSKRSLPDWYKGTAVQYIRPVDIDSLTSERYWKKWDRVTCKAIEKIASKFFKKVSEIESPKSDCFLFDTTNYYTYMAGQTPSELAKRGKNKEGKNWLRQIGIALLIVRDTQLPFFYREYEGNRHDSKQFQEILEPVASAMRQALGGEEKELTIVFDKGMNSEDNIAIIDTMPRLHFITSYSPHYAEELTRVKISEFEIVDTPRNRELLSLGREDDRLAAWRTDGEYWGKTRTVVVTYNPLTATKQRYAFDKKLLSLQETLVDLRAKVRTQKEHWTKQARIESHYNEACEKLHLPKDLYDISLEKNKDKWQCLYRKNHHRIGQYLQKFGKNILITDQNAWSTEEIVRASLDRYMVEKAFRQSKDDDLVSVFPVRHWTDSKIRCHILTCIVALTYLRLIEVQLQRSDLPLTAATAMAHMRLLHSCLCWIENKQVPNRLVEDPTKIQAQILKAFDSQVTDGVLQTVYA
jgi:transposase